MAPMKKSNSQTHIDIQNAIEIKYEISEILSAVKA